MSPGELTELRSERLVYRRADTWAVEPLVEFFARNVDHLDPWLPEAVPLARDPAWGANLLAVSEEERRAGREERWFVASADDPDAVVGYVFLTRFRRDGHCSCEVSFGIGEAHLGRGLMTEAVGRMLAHAADTLGFSRVDARHAVDNPASGRVLERLGFVRIGVAPAHARVGGLWRDHVLVTRVRRHG